MIIALYIAGIVSLISSNLYTVFTDEILRNHYVLVLYLCVCFFIVICLLAISNLFVLQRKYKATAKRVYQLYDSDIESDDESKIIPQKNTEVQGIRKIHEFIQLNPIYKLIGAVGMIFLSLSSLLSACSCSFEQKKLTEDLRSSSLRTLLTGMLLLLIVCIRMNIKFEQTKTKKSLYRPFDEIVEIPMKVFVRKYLSLLDYWHLLGGLFFEFLALWGMVTVSDMSEGDMTEFESGASYEEIHSRLFYVMCFANFCAPLILVDCLMKAYSNTKEGLMGVFEKNWQRNMCAYQFLLPETDVETLEDLHEALIQKYESPKLTNQEKKIIRYISKPLWQTKQGFVAAPFKEKKKPGKNANASEDASDLHSGEDSNDSPEEDLYDMDMSDVLDSPEESPAKD